MASTSDGASTSQAVGPCRSVHPVAATQRMRTAPRGGGGSPSPAAYLPNNPRWTWTIRSPKAANRCLPWAVMSSSTRPSTRAASTNRPCGLDTSITRPPNWARWDRARRCSVWPPALHARCAADAGARSAAAAKPPRASAVMAWAWLNPGVERRGDVDTVAAGRQPLGPRRRSDPRRRPSAGRRWSTCRSPCDRRSAQRGEATASAGCRRGRTAAPRPAGGSAAEHRRPSCRTRQPARRRGWPSPAQRVRGTPAWVAASAGRVLRLNPRLRSCRLMPVVGSTSHDPKPDAFDWIRLTAVPPAPAVHRYVVSPGVAATGRSPACSRSTRPARSSIAASRAAPSAQSWSTSGRSNDAVDAASTRTCAQRASSAARQPGALFGQPGGPEQEVPPGRPGRSSAARPRTPLPPARRPSRPATAPGRPRRSARHRARGGHHRTPRRRRHDLRPRWHEG